MNTIVGGKDYSVWLGGIEYILGNWSEFSAGTIQGIEFKKRITSEKLQEAALQLGYFPCKDIEIERSTSLIELMERRNA